MPELSLDEAVDLTRTGDGWVLRGGSVADVWTGQHRRGVRLHDLADAVRTWRRLLRGATLGPEIPVDVPAAHNGSQVGWRTGCCPGSGGRTR